MTGEEKRRSRLRRFLPHRHVSENTLAQLKPPTEDRRSSSSSIQDKQGDPGTPPEANSGTLEAGKRGLWDEVYDAFVASEPSPDLRDVARKLRNKSREISSSTASDPNVEARASREWHLCKEFQKLAETKATELSKGGKGKVPEILQRAYSETIGWVEEFVAVGDVVCQIDPVHIGLPWAGIRAILIIAIQNQQTLSEILAGVTSLSKLICRYAVFEAVYLQGKPQLQEPLNYKLSDALKSLYVAAFQYLVEATLYLERKTISKLLHGITLSERLRQLYDEIEKQEAEVLRYETMTIKDVSYAQYAEVRSKLCTYEDHLRSEQRKQVTTWLSKIAYYSHHKEMNERVLRDTGQWFQSSKEFKAWTERDECSLLWLRGNAGTGKTSLISCVIEELLQRPCLENSEGFAYFYCSRTTNDKLQRDPKAILLSILRQLASPAPGLPLKPPILSVYQREEARGSQDAQLSIEEITALMNDLVQNHYTRITLVIDALDECDVGKRAKLLDIITKLTYNPRSVVKALVSSRNEPDIEDHFSRIKNKWVTAADNARDIMAFIKTNLSERLLAGRASDHLIQRVEDELIAKANGIFRWVALQVDALCDPERTYTERDIEHLLPRLPKTLEETYASIVDGIDSLEKPSHDLLTNVIKLMMCAEYQMEVRQVLEALSIISESPKVEGDEDTILRMGRGLIISEDHPYSYFAFAHLSVREFFENKPDFNGESAHAIAAEACLKFYTRSTWDYVEYSAFRNYASNYVDQHCVMSGKKRQESRLRDLMQEFLLQGEPHTVFARWHIHRSEAVVSTSSRDLYLEQSVLSNRGFGRPLPLFMICVRGLDELIDPAIAQSKSALFAKNNFGLRPLEVAASAGNLVTMKLIHKAASSMIKSPIRAKEWLVAAADSDDLSVWRFALEHIQNVPVRSAFIKAAQAQENGKEMVCDLLKDINDIDEEMLVEILPCCASLDTLDVILAKSHMARFTERMLEAAVLNPTINPALVERILAEGQELRVSETSILLAFQGSSKYRESVIKAMLNYHPRCEISEEVVYSVARYCRNESTASLSLLLEHFRMDQTTEDWLAGSAANITSDIFEFFLERLPSPMISQQVLQNRLTYYSRINTPEHLFSQPNCPSVSEESLDILLEQYYSPRYMWVPMDHSEPLYITDRFLQACAAKLSLSNMRTVMSLPRAIQISKQVLNASVKNYFHAADILDLLLQHTLVSDHEPSEDLLLAALSNHGHKKLETVRFLAHHWNALPVSEASMAASVDVWSDGTQVFEYLLEHCESVELGFSDHVLLSAIRGNNLQYVEYYKQRRPNFEIKEEYLIAAVTSVFPNIPVLQALLSQLGDSTISETVLETASRAGNQTIVELILEQPGAPHRTQDISDLAEGTSLHEETDEDVTSERVLSAIEADDDYYGDKPLLEHVKDGGPWSSYASFINTFELSTTKINRLLLKYHGPKINSSLLVEAAAKRKDGKFIMQYLLSRFPKTVVTQRALLAAAGNQKALTTLLEFLLDFSGAKVDMVLLRAAAENEIRGTSLIEMLLARLPADTKIETDVISTALKNPYRCRSILGLILKRQPGLEVNQELVDAASANAVQGNFLLHELLKHSLMLHPTASAEVILHKMRSSENGLQDYLFIAACYGPPSVLRYLLSEGASVHAISGELGTPLNVAARAGDLDAVDILLLSGSDCEARSSVYGTPLHTACEQGALAIIETLVKHGVEIDRRDQRGWTELHTALRRGEYGLVCLLLSLGASVTICDYQGMAAMHHASTNTESAECITKLIEPGALVDQEDSQQWTPLHWAAKSGSTDTVKALLQAGSSKTKLDASGRTPFQVAMLCGNHHLRAQLVVESESGGQSGAVGRRHKGVACGLCNMEIWGPRYKCADCKDFDLCFRCIADADRLHHADHHFNKL